jgi:DNA-3-methyladenine glycosylase II
MKASLNQVTYRIHPVPPFRLDFTVWALRRRPDNIIDQWDGQTYRRALLSEDKVIRVEVKQNSEVDQPELLVSATGKLSDTALKATSATLERILGTQIDLKEFYHFARQDKDLGPLILQFQGVKPPRFPTIFEALLNSISCQQITLSFCLKLLNRLVEKWGPSISSANIETWAFPEAHHMVGTEPDDLRSMGYSYNKARAILEIVELIVTKKLNLDEVIKLDDAAAISTLMQLRGVGHWTAEYTLLRGDGRTHIFPTGDAGAISNLRRWLNKDQAMTPQMLQSILSSWKPFVGLVYFHLLLRKLSELGYLN